MQKIQGLFNKFLESKRTFWIVLAIVFVAARLAVWFYPYDSDHWIFYYVGRAIANGQLLYVNAWDHKPPLIFEFNALMHLLFGGNIVLHRIFLTFLTFLDIFLFYKLAGIFSKEFFSRNADKVVRVALLVYVFWRNLSQFASSGNNTENIGIIFLLLMFIAFFKWYSNGKLKHWNFTGNWKLEIENYSFLFLSGACLSVLFYLKPNMSLLSIPILVEIFLLSYRNLKKFIVNYLVFGAAFLAQTAFWIVYFSSQNALKDFWVASFAFSSAYAKSTWAGNVSPQGIFILMLAPLVVPVGIFAVRFLKDFKKIKQDGPYRFLFFMFFSSVAFGLALGSFYPYYFLILLPTFILVIAYSGDVFMNLKKTKNLLLVFMLLTGMGISLLISYKQLLNSFSGPVKSELNEYRQISDYIKENSTTEDKIVAYTYGAVLYRMAERDSGSRFISASVLLLDERDQYGFNLSDTFINELNQSKPKYWIISKEGDSLYYQNKKIVLYMFNNFVLEKEFDNYMVLIRK